MLKFISVLPSETYAGIRTDSPIEEIWSQLMMFSDSKYLSKTWAGKSEEELIICSTCLSQAREYHLASKTVSLKTRPLLTYYSFLNLTKAVLFMLNDKLPEDYHGLCEPEIGAELPDCIVKANKGVFYSLAQHQGKTFQVKEPISLKTMLSNSLELYRDFEMYFGAKSFIVCPSLRIHMDGDIEINFSRRQIDETPDLKSRLEAVPGLLGDFEVSETGDGILLKNRAKVGNTDDGAEVNARSIVSKYFTYSILPDSNIYINLNPVGEVVPQATAYFGIMFLLGTLVRYAPQYLYKILDNRDTSVRWFFGKMCDVSERIYPNLMLNLLYKQTIKFASSF